MNVMINITLTDYTVQEFDDLHALLAYDGDWEITLKPINNEG